MSFGRQVYEFLLSGSQAYAKWDLEVSTSILKNRKKLLLILALAVPILAGCLADGCNLHLDASAEQHPHLLRRRLGVDDRQIEHGHWTHRMQCTSPKLGMIGYQDLFLSALQHRLLDEDQFRVLVVAHPVRDRRRGHEVDVRPELAEGR